MTTSNEVTRTVDLTPSHAFEAAICIEVLRNPNASPEGIKEATDGLMNLARACDKAATCEPDLILDAGRAVKDLTDYIREVAALDGLARADSRPLTDRAVIVTQVGEPDDWGEDLESNAYKSGKQVDYKALAASQHGQRIVRHPLRTAKDRE